MMVAGLELCRRDHPNLSMQAPVVEPVDVVEGGLVDVVEAAPGTVLVDELRLVVSVEGFSHGVVVGVSLRAHGGHCAFLAEALSVANAEVLHASVAR